MFNPRQTSSMASQARVYRGENAIDSNRAAFRISDGVLNFHKVGSAHTGLDMSKIAQYDGQYYDSSTREFAQIRAKEAADKTAVGSGLNSTATSLNLDKNNALGYKDRQRINADQAETERRYAEDLARPSVYGV